ncbi:triose-phosphate isomerase [Weissella soli]|uniref:Triosephosphate isomerase n=1 Tax=Weissella soli TaxID=155866 RepID=A0A288QLR1_9LACO|nr:triose-phosphate isomerase [Weissella soli]AOT56086.1 Triose-phosphate isomerase [Weissella soli]MCT8394704.1 triose-phosphate isomerase [Weissella soli]NKY82545.1 triose-phosphate isomerase [Weissella soli]QEA34998.1 triose-phosphate isomerase [Weissella soli]RDL11660.1 triosephosphate isomerase [Weissella soli]
MIGVLNFKNLVDFEQQLQFLDDLSHEAVDFELYVAPTLPVASQYDNFKIVSQNLTIPTRTVGEISPSVLHHLNIDTSFIGHLERRKSLNEGLLIVRERLANALANNIRPILSVGQYSDIRLVVEELDTLLHAQPLAGRPIILAYESLASTELGKALYSIDELRDVHNNIRRYMAQNQPEVEYKFIVGGHMDEVGAPIAHALGYDGVLIGDRYHDVSAFKPVLTALNQLA